MAQQLNIEVVIDGSLIVNPFISLILSQSVHHHHHFELRFSQDLKSGNDPVFLSKYNAYLGKSISITLGEDYYSISKDNKESNFKGIVTNIQMNNDVNDPGSIIVSGYGASCALETARICTTHKDKSLDQIFKTVSKDVPGNALNTNVNPQNKKRISYLVQYKETTWNFLKRVSALYGEWLFYNGTELFFGKPNQIPTIEVSYPHQISSLSYSIGTAPVKFKANTFMLEKSAKTEEFESKKAGINGLGNFQDQIIAASEDVYVISGQYPAQLWQDKADLELEVKAIVGSSLANLAIVSGASDHPGIQVGTVADIQKEGSSLGKFLIIEVTHTADGNGNYNNYFKGIPADTKYLPQHDFSIPVAETQIGRVISNECPDGHGKIQVQLMWQLTESASDYPWLDVISPSAGSFGSNDKNRGFHFTPEVDDYVVVSFTDGDPSKPFVSGSIPTHDKRSSSDNKENFEKTISTRSGNTIYFRDKENSDEQEIRIETDPENYISIQLKGKDGTVFIKSSKDIIVESEKLIDFKTEEFKVRAKNISFEAEKDITISSKGNTKMKAEKKTEISANSGITAQSMDSITLKATKMLEGSGLDVDLKGTKSVKASGAMAELAGSAMTTIKGALVKIN
jgi:hypothetical protein